MDRIMMVANTITFVLAIIFLAALVVSIGFVVVK